MNPAQILLINWRDTKNPEAGGAEIYYHEIFSRLATHPEYRITLLCHAFAGAPSEETIDGIHVLRRGGKFLFNFSAMFFIWRQGKKYDLIIEDLNKIPFFTPLFSRRPKLHLVMHFFRKSIFQEAPFPLAAYVYLLESLIPFAYKTQKFVAISNSTRDEIATWASDSKNISVVEPGCDTDFFHPVCAKSQTPLLFYIGRVKKYKNIQFVIQALKRIRTTVPKARLVIAGGGDYIPELKKLADSLGLSDSVQFLGRISEIEKREWLSKAWAIVNPSFKEGWGITNIEANLCSTVSISSRVPGLKDSVQDCITGFLYEIDSMEEFIIHAIEIIENPTERKVLEENALQFGQTFSWDHMTEKMKPHIDQALAGRA